VLLRDIPIYMPSQRAEKTDFISIRVEPHIKQTIASIGKTPTELITQGLYDQIKAHSHLLLERIYKTKLQQGWLPQTDWHYLAQKIYGAFEATSFANSRFTTAQLIDLHNAFRNLVEFAISANSDKITHYYSGNLISNSHPTTRSSLIQAIDAAKKIIESHEQGIPWPEDSSWLSRPFPSLLGRNLDVALREEQMTQSDINTALNPYWKTIWEIAAAKHWHDFQQPLDIVTRENWTPMHHDTETLREGGTTITIWTLNDKPNIQINITLEHPNIFWYPNSFPEIQELQRALASVPKITKKDDHAVRFWEGPAYEVMLCKHGGTQKELEISLNIRKANLSLYFEDKEWRTLGKLLNVALAQSDVPTRIEALKLQYGSTF